MFDHLRLYLAHFAGMRVTALEAGTSTSAPAADSVKAVRAALGVEEPGKPVEVNGTSGRLERVGPQHLLVRLAEPVPGMLAVFGFDHEGGTSVRVAGYLFADDAAAYVARSQPTWQAWIDATARTASPTV